MYWKQNKKSYAFFIYKVIITVCETQLNWKEKNEVDNIFNIGTLRARIVKSNPKYYCTLFWGPYQALKEHR